MYTNYFHHASYLCPIDNNMAVTLHDTVCLHLSIMQSLVSLAAACIVVLQYEMYIGACTAETCNILILIL